VVVKLTISWLLVVVGVVAMLVEVGVLEEC
jgi:hypothetical protein